MVSLCIRTPFHFFCMCLFLKKKKKKKKKNRTVDGKITDCYSFSLAIDDRCERKIHLLYSVSKPRAYNKTSLSEYCKVRCHALLQD